MSNMTSYCHVMPCFNRNYTLLYINEASDSHFLLKYLDSNFNLAIFAIVIVISYGTEDD